MTTSPQALDVTFVTAEARGLEAIESAFGTMARERAQALFVLSEGLMFNYRGRIGATAISGDEVIK